jgi:Zn-dependent protease with chaperone function
MYPSRDVLVQTGHDYCKGCDLFSSMHSYKAILMNCSALARWLVLMALITLAGCSTNPMTGRSQLLLVSEESAISGASSAYSSMIGALAKKSKLETSTPRAKRVQEITDQLIAEAVRFRPESANWHWEVRVIDDPKTINAFCMAGGKMGIYTGFWEKLYATDDEIANVMGHEIGHALASHTREKMSVAMTAGLGAAVLSALVAARNSSNPAAFRATHDTLGLAAALAVTLPHSREAETEADQIGIELAARAGFDPRAAVALWRKMAAKDRGPIEFFSTHPSPDNRAQRLENLVAKVDPLYQAALARKLAGGLPIPAFVGESINVSRTEGISRETYTAQLAADPQTLTFVSEDFDKFKRGDAVFDCTFECAISYGLQKGKWKAMHEKQSWRDLAVSVVRVGYLNDLSYFLLGEAARGLNLMEAARIYYSRAIEAVKTEKTCSGVINTCEGFDVSGLASSALSK